MRNLRLAGSVLFLAFIAILSVSCHVDPPADVDPPIVEPSGPGRVTLTVSNQSFELSAVAIDVFLDGSLVVSDQFEVGNQHNFVQYEFEWPQGRRILRAVSPDGGVTGEAEIEVTDQNWGYVGFLYRLG